MRGRPRRTKPSRAIELALLALSVVPFAGCSDSSSFEAKQPGACESVLSKLQECNMATTGTLRLEVALDSITSCRYECYAQADCAELNQLLCAGNPLGSLAMCVTGCTTFRCTNGDSVDLQYQCDGTPNCADGSDEAGCQMFECADGTIVGPSRRCDYRYDCSDRSDEAGCPPGFGCADGQTVSRESRCNGVTDCGDYSDETGCPTYPCANGQQAIGTARCNGFPECSDRSDEADCPPVPSAICNGQSMAISTFFGASGCH